MNADATPETVVCDTSYVGYVTRPMTVQTWPEEVRNRLNQAVQAISVISVMETRYGMRAAHWGAKRTSENEALLAAYVWIPLDLQIVDLCADLKVRSKESGWNLSDNDAWIMATAWSRQLPLVTCDRDQRVLKHLGVEVIYLSV